MLLLQRRGPRTLGLGGWVMWLGGGAGGQTTQPSTRAATHSLPATTPTRLHAAAAADAAADLLWDQYLLDKLNNLLIALNT